jgi:hypothetical protein
VLGGRSGMAPVVSGLGMTVLPKPSTYVYQ